MDEILATFLGSLFTIASGGLGALIMYMIKRRDNSIIADENSQREKDRELEREQREKDREQERYLKLLERNLHDDRVSVYFEILRPLILHYHLIVRFYLIK